MSFEQERQLESEVEIGESGFRVLCFDDGSGELVDEEGKRYTVMCSEVMDPFCSDTEAILASHYYSYEMRKDNLLTSPEDSRSIMPEKYKPIFYEEPSRWRVEEDVEVCMVVREETSFQVQEIRFMGSVGWPEQSIVSGMVVEPEELRGMIVVPRNQKDKWDLVRPYFRGHCMSPKSRNFAEYDLANSVAMIPRTVLRTRSLLSGEKGGLKNINVKNLEEGAVFSLTEIYEIFENVAQVYCDYHGDLISLKTMKDEQIPDGEYSFSLFYSLPTFEKAYFQSWKRGIGHMPQFCYYELKVLEAVVENGQMRISDKGLNLLREADMRMTLSHLFLLKDREVVEIEKEGVRDEMKNVLGMKYIWGK